MNLQQTTRGVQHLLYTLGASLGRFRGENGLQHLVSTGKLSLLSLFGVFERTRDEEYEKRSIAVSETRRCLLQLVDDFEEISGETEKLMGKIHRLLGTLEQFHRCCDMEVNDRANASDSYLPQLEKYFRHIQESGSQLRGFVEDFSASKTTCVDLTRTAIKEIEKVDADTSCDVAAALADFDRQRRRLQVKENEVLHAMSGATSREDPAVRYAELNCMKEAEALESFGRKYIDSLGNAMMATHFALEQSSMTGWASCNVFFVQLGQLFSEMSASGKAIAENLMSIKNSQKVSHQLSEEKRRILQEQRGTATEAGVETSTSINSFSGDTNALPAASSPLATPSLAIPSVEVRLPTEEPGSGPVNLDDLFS
ncbi:hypothetical protein, conserved [Leishmania tarentolae]|uniref:Uncharacterized protein n=1 Tax=Leishmania tarentolae TaxID=5689 RepID=A0A640KNC3_LEITA|nr:hypothetical protein, conserved [Leishmania tarentolae]